jgi:hypothetical protein
LKRGPCLEEGRRKGSRDRLPAAAGNSENETEAEFKRQNIWLKPMETRIRMMTVALCTILTGCVGTGPNTQRGAVEGGALGSVAGAVIGNNSGGRNGPAGALIGAIVGAIAGGTIGNSIDNQNGTIYGRPMAAVPGCPAYASSPDVVVAQPGPSAVWVPGYWEWTGAEYTWVAGCWTVPPAGFNVYVRGGWILRGGGYYYRRPYWR